MKNYEVTISATKIFTQTIQVQAEDDVEADRLAYEAVDDNKWVEETESFCDLETDDIVEVDEDGNPIDDEEDDAE